MLCERKTYNCVFQRYFNTSTLTVIPLGNQHLSYYVVYIKCLSHYVLSYTANCSSRKLLYMLIPRELFEMSTNRLDCFRHIYINICLCKYMQVSFHLLFTDIFRIIIPKLYIFPTLKFPIFSHICHTCTYASNVLSVLSPLCSSH